ncbi:cystatin 10-like [Nannospalax galili]|uniref:Cystatin D n=1 Tax=Nannospalax galili TaxID=1026970 RepID=A0A8C6QP88_NANGA|nr:cystatin 10-like [Nannospalax galili]
MASPLCPAVLLLAAFALILALAVNPAVSINSKDKQVAVGRVEEADPNDQETQKVVNFAVKTYNDLNNDLYLSRPIRVMSANQQVVTGKNFYLKIELGRTICTKAQSDSADCPFSEQSDQQKKVTCNFEINTKPWLNEMSMTNFNCHSA